VRGGGRSTQATVSAKKGVRRCARSRGKQADPEASGGKPRPPQLSAGLVRAAGRSNVAEATRRKGCHSNAEKWSRVKKSKGKRKKPPSLKPDIDGCLVSMGTIGLKVGRNQRGEKFPITR